MNSWRALVSSVDRSAVVDGESLLKYVFNAQDGSEELFDLRADPKETINLATKPAHSRSVARLRAALVKQYQREGRGEGWVQMGKLVWPRRRQATGQNYPSQSRTRR